MDNRFTFKDFIFLCAFLLVIGSVVWVGYQFSYQEKRLTGALVQLQQFNDVQKQQIGVLQEIKNVLRKGVSVNTTSTQEATGASPEGAIRRTDPDGTTYVSYPRPPKSPRNPRDAADYAQGDWLVWNLGNEPKVLTPLIEKDAYGQDVQTPIMESLVTRNAETMEFEPLLAETFTVSPDGRVLTFTLRKEVRFSDGKPVTADDILFTFDTIRNPAVDCAPLRGYFENLDSYKKIDARTVEFKFRDTYFKAIEMVGGVGIMPAHVYAFKDGREYNSRGALVVGSGPYKLQAWDRGQQITLVRNENYWSEPATFDKVVLKFIKNPQAAFQAFQGGDIDAAIPDPDQWTQFSADPVFAKKVTMYKYLRPNAGYAYIGYNLDRPIFKDKLTRQALTMLIDRNEVIHQYLRDLAVPITSPFSTLSDQNDKSIKPWPYDPDAARKKLAAAGWKPGADGVLERDGVRFDFALSMGTGNPVTERIVAYVQRQFEQAGIRVRITPYEFSVLTERIDKHDFDAVTMGWTGGLEEDPYQIWHSSSIADQGSNFISFRNAESDKLIEDGRRTIDTKKRMEIWHKWQALIHDEQPYTFMYVSMSRVFINQRFKNTAPYRTGVEQYDWFVPANLQKYH